MKGPRQRREEATTASLKEKMARKKATLLAEEAHQHTLAAEEVNLDDTLTKLRQRLLDARALYSEMQVENDSIESRQEEEITKLDHQIERQCASNHRLREEIAGLRAELQRGEADEAWASQHRQDAVSREQDEAMLLQAELRDVTAMQRRERARLVRCVLGPSVEPPPTRRLSTSICSAGDTDQLCLPLPPDAPCATAVISKPHASSARAPSPPRGMAARISAARRAQRAA